MYCHARSRRSTAPRGVILLVILGLLSLFMLIVVSYVMMSSNERRGAIAASRAEQHGDDFTALINQAILQVIRGGRNPRSPISPHSLMEDFYGNRETVVGMIFNSAVPGDNANNQAPGYPVNPRYPQASALNNFTIGPRPTANVLSSEGGGEIIELLGVSFGVDGQPGVAGRDDDGDGVVDNCSGAGGGNSSEWGNGGLQNGGDLPMGSIPRYPWLPASATNPICDNIDGFYTGRVLTIVDGKCARQSTHIIKWFFAAGQWRMWVRPFDNGILPEAFDRFVINGRPFNGAGFGYSSGSILNNKSPAALTPTPPSGSDNYEYALMPNPTEIAYRYYMKDVPLVPNDYNLPLTSFNFADGVDADEDYDAADFNNLALAGQRWNGARGRWEVNIPSFHRPELLNYWMASGRLGGTLTNWDQIPAAASGPGRIRQRIMLRPDPQDHFLPQNDFNGDGKWNGAEPWIDFNGNGVPEGSGSGAIAAGNEWTDTNGNQVYDYGEPSYAGNLAFHAINGPWDVDNDNDGLEDSVWLDLGMHAQVNTEGKTFKPLFAILCLDMDGRINLNAHGNPTHYRYMSIGSPLQIPYYPQMIPPTANGPVDEVYILNQTTHQANQSTYPPGITSRAETLKFNGNMGGPYAGGLGMPNATLGNPANGANVNTMPTGSGEGVAEINLGYILETPMVPSTAIKVNGATTLTNIHRRNFYRWILEGRHEGLASGTGAFNVTNLQPSGALQPAIPGKYGEPHLIDSTRPGVPIGTALSTPRAGLTAHSTNVGGQQMIAGDDNYPAAPMERTLASQYAPAAMRANAFLLRGDVWGTSSLATHGNYGSPPDPYGQLATGVDFRGNAIHGNQQQNGYPEGLDDPYEINLYPKTERRMFDPGPDGIPYTTDDPITPQYGRRSIDIDAPFTPAELELILRGHEFDVGNPQSRVTNWYESLRCVIVIDGAGGNMRRRITTESWDVPSPNLVPTPEIAFGLTQLGLPTTNLSIGDLFRGKLKAVNPSAQLTPDINTTVQQYLDQTNPVINNMTKRLVSADLVNGLRMNINRPFGNGADDNNNGTIDDQAEITGALERLWKNSNLDIGRVAPANQPGLTFDANGDGIIYTAGNPVTKQEAYSKQEFARQLYVLMMLLTDSGYVRPLTISPVNGQPAEALSQADQRRFTAFRIAQWAINVVDFRDRDGIMTPFEFDVYPFSAQATPGTIGGWDVDDDPNSVDDAGSGTKYRGLVWGMEYPDLLLTETFGWHDKRVADTNQESSHAGRMAAGKTTDMGMNKDPHFDQVRLPQGGLAVEVYATGRTNTIYGTADPHLTYYPRELYNIATPLDDGSYGAVDLGRMAPQTTGAIGQNPVWRLAVSNPHYGRDSNSTTVREMALDPYNAAGTGAANDYYPDTSTMRPDQFDLLQRGGGSSPPATIGIDRIVWFTNQAPLAGHPSFSSIYYGKQSTPASVANPKPLLLAPGRFAVVGPYRPSTSGAANVTSFGFTNAAGGSQPNWGPMRLNLENVGGGAAYLSTNMIQPIALGGNAAAAFAPLPTTPPYPVNTAGAPQQTDKILPPLGIPAGRVVTNAGITVGAQKWVGLNISEPLAGYPATYQPSSPTADPHTGVTWNDAYPTTSIQDVPADIGNNVLNGAQPMCQPGTYIDVRTVFLQRLANPLLPWNPEAGQNGHQANIAVNPYITVDWMPIDLTVFNGQNVYPLTSGTEVDAENPQSAAERTAMGFPTQNSPTAPQNYRRTANHDLFFQTRERGPRITESVQPPVRPDQPAAAGMTPTALPANLVYNNNSAWPMLYAPSIVNAGQTTEAPLWAAVSDDPHFQRRGNPPQGVTPLRNGSPPFNFYHNLTHTLGFMNAKYGSRYNGTATNTATLYSTFLDRSSLATGANHYPNNLVDPNILNHYIGSPQRAFPWLTWNNRPYANAMELMIVPACSSSRFGIEFNYITNNSTNVAGLQQPTRYQTPTFDWNHYSYYPGWPLGTWTAATPVGVATPSPRLPHRPWTINTGVPHYQIQGQANSLGSYPFGHLLNFFASNGPANPAAFQTANSSTVPTQNPADNTAMTAAPNYHRIFEFVNVPTRFSGSEEILLGPPSGVARNLYEAPTGLNSHSPNAPNLAPFYMPFNRVSKYREPGKININTLVDSSGGNTSAVLSAIMNGFPNDNGHGLWGDLQTTIMGLGHMPSLSTNQEVLRRAQGANAAPYPTFFPNLFRSFTSNYRAPLASMVQPFAYVDSNLLRRAPGYNNNTNTYIYPSPTSSAPPNCQQPLFAYNFVSSYATNYRDPNRNPYFRYQPLIKLGNMLTTRSNVYAIWVTVGFFEVQPVPSAQRASTVQSNPDGYILVRELGSDTGNIQRHRGFAIVDRTIPVGFQRGENHNIDKAILVKRIIE